jgi:hypothetical protein
MASLAPFLVGNMKGAWFGFGYKFLRGVAGFFKKAALLKALTGCLV